MLIEDYRFVVNVLNLAFVRKMRANRTKWNRWSFQNFHAERISNTKFNFMTGSMSKASEIDFVLLIDWSIWFMYLISRSWINLRSINNISLQVQGSDILSCSKKIINLILTIVQNSMLTHLIRSIFILRVIFSPCIKCFTKLLDSKFVRNENTIKI